MLKQPLGSSGLSVSSLCLGCMLFGTVVSREDSYAVLDAYYEAGGRFLDTSNNYAFWVEGGKGGESEELIGAWLKDRGCRDEMVIATKMGAFPRSDEPDDREGLSAKAIRRAVDESLQRMGLDHIDLYYTHFDDRDTPQEETLAALDREVNSGKVRVLGASNHLTWRLDRARRICEDNGFASYQAIQQRLSYLAPQRNLRIGIQKLADDNLLDYLQEERELMLVGYTVLLRGTYVTGEPKNAYETRENFEKLKVLGEIAKELGVTNNQLALAWAIHAAPLSVPLISTSKVDHLPELIGALDVQLDESHLERLSMAGQLGA